MYSSKKAQISDTISWIVATVIIVLILGVPIFLVQAKMINTDRIAFQRIQDPLATKAISGYLLENYEPIMKPAIAKGDFSVVEASIYPFLLSLRRAPVEGWNVEIEVDKNEVYKNATYTTINLPSRWKDNFYFKDAKGDVMINFYLEGQFYE